MLAPQAKQVPVPPPEAAAAPPPEAPPAPPPPPEVPEVPENELEKELKEADSIMDAVDAFCNAEAETAEVSAPNNLDPAAEKPESNGTTSNVVGTNQEDDVPVPVEAEKGESSSAGVASKGSPEPMDLGMYEGEKMVTSEKMKEWMESNDTQPRHRRKRRKYLR
jgi:hypothetical protein